MLMTSGLNSTIFTQVYRILYAKDFEMHFMDDKCTTSVAR